MWYGSLLSCLWLLEAPGSTPDYSFIVRTLAGPSSPEGDLRR